MVDFINSLNALVIKPVCGVPFIVLFVVTVSAYLTLRLKFNHILLSFKPSNSRKSSLDKKKDEISGFSAFMTAAGSTLGIGNIVGGAIAVTIGGAGTMFWIFILSLLISSLKFCETFFGHKYRIESSQGIISGGAFFYIKSLLGKRSMPKLASSVALIYTIFFVIAYTCAGSFQLNQVAHMIGSVTIHKSLQNDPLQYFIISIPIAIFCLICVNGGIKRIGSFSSAAVPFMAGGHILCSMFVILANSSKIISVFSEIFYQAFHYDALKGGMLYVIAYSLQRIIFASDAGTGSAAIANSNSSKSPVEQALIVAFEPMLVALMMLMSGLVVLVTDSHIFAEKFGLQGISVIDNAFSSNIMLKSIFWLNVSLFGITTIIGNAYYIEKAWNFIFNGKFLKCVNYFYCSIVAIGAVLPFAVIMPFADASFFITMTINTIILFIFVREPVNAIKEYIKR